MTDEYTGHDTISGRPTAVSAEQLEQQFVYTEPEVVSETIFEDVAQPAQPQPQPQPQTPWGTPQIPVQTAAIPTRERSFSAKHLWLTALASLIAALLGASLASFLILGNIPTVTTIERLVPTPAREALGIDTGTDLSVNVAAKVLPSVVSISVTQEQMTMMGIMTAEGSGSGVIMREDGYILTNYHVIESGSSIMVTANSETYEATVVGTDPSSDLAVLKIDANDLPMITIGNSSDLKVGQYVMAVGNPFGLSESVSVGIISALGRTEAFQLGNQIAAYANLIQTDAAINPGNSGGALVDADGRLIGINTLIKTTSGSSAGVGFAIPVDTALDIANQLIEGVEVSHPFLGVATQSVDAMAAQQLQLPVETGAYIVEVVSGSPAQRAGFQIGDIIVRIGDRAITTTEDVFAAVRSHREGDTVTVEFYRGGELSSVEVTLGNDTATVQSIPSAEYELEEASRAAEGMGGSEGNNSSGAQGSIIPQELLDLIHQNAFESSW
ncbi:MAG: trypsin-like peptidase domain-containing protein [Coriobacteriia bacterium]|nr:trypsin-like peptidase domain-containing protein [Coriobacteriia bacterium]